MRLAALIADLADSDLERLATEHVRTDERLARPQLCNFLESAIRSFRFIREFVTNRQPPTFSILTTLLDAPEYSCAASELKDTAMSATWSIAEMIERGDLLARDDQLQLYRRTFYEARRNDLDVNSSEAVLLGVIRREQDIHPVEHFLMEHHQDFREFWDREDCYEHELRALRSAGLVFESRGQLLIAEDVAPAIWTALGIVMPKESARRLYSYLSNTELADILAAAGSRISGSKEQRAERLLNEWIQPSFALQSVALATLKDICRATDAASSGNKDDLVERIVAHFAQGRDQHIVDTVEVRPAEERRLPQQQFELLFSSLLHQELSDILRRRPELRQTGTKELRIRTLWEAQLSETSLLGDLMNRQLEDILQRLGLRLAGSKSARIERIIDRFAVESLSPSPQQASVAKDSSASTPTAVVPSPLVIENLANFRQRASSPQASLQPWLEALLDAAGQIRCYATEDENPTKQLKNKLSQAASARNGLLVLLLADESAFSKARDALVERWMANEEWPKGVAAVALAYPLANPEIHSIVERTQNAWSGRVQAALNPGAEIVRVDQFANVAVSCCKVCDSELPDSARFCPNCGSPAHSDGPVDSSLG